MRWARAPLVLLSVVAATAAGAVTVRTWGPASAEGFAKGTLQGTSLDAEGWLSLAPTSATWWGPGAGIVWDVAPDGERGAFVALSGPARVLRLVPGKPPETWYEESGDAMVTALAPDGRGGVLLAVSPGGRILHARGAGQPARAHFTTEGRYVWALAVAGDRVWIGAGDPGALLRGKLTGGSLETVATTGEDPVRAVVPLPGGGVAVGTGRRGRVLQVGAAGMPGVFALLDADEDEIVDLAADRDGVLWVLAARDRGRARLARPSVPEETPRPASDPAEPRPAPGPEPEPEDPAPGAAPEEPRPQAAPRSPRVSTTASAAATGALYKIAADGAVTRVWESSTEIPYALAIVGGSPVVGTGDSGRLLRIDHEGAAAALLRVPSEQITALALTPSGRLLAGGSNDARVEALGPEIATTGTWLSDVFDAGTVSDWGAVRWDGAPGAGNVSASLRVGNTSEPDDTWSAWGAVRAGESASLPVARFLQARLELKGAGSGGPRVRRLEVAYRARNRAPRIRRLEVETPGVAIVSQPASTTGASGPVVAEDPVAQRAARASGRRPSTATRRLYEAGARSASWEASDADEDALRYTVELRAVGQEGWRVLATDLETTFYSWDSRGTPDGLYELRLTASDGEDNPAGTARSHVRVSDPFLIDHTAPRLESVQLSADRRRVTFLAVDPGGRVAAVEAAQGASAWRRLSPEDGIEDGERERYALDLQDGETLRLRVTDAAGNLGGAESVPR
jgi:hypothetical protein